MRVLLTALFALFVASSPALTDEKKMDRTIVISGHGEVRVAPDMATISLGVASFAETAKAALDDNNASMEKLFAQLKAAGVSERDLITSNFNVNPRLDYAQDNSRPPKTVGYDVSNTLTVVVRKLPDLGAILDKSISSGSNQAYGLSFSVAKPEPHLDEARRAAVADARHKAEVLAGAAGLELGSIISLNEGGGAAPTVIAYTKAAAAEADGVLIAAGDLTLSADVTIGWAVK